MAALKDFLPVPKTNGFVYYDHSNDPWFKQRYSRATTDKSNPIPPYLKRAGFKPIKPEDFGDGGAFPEIHIVQYILDMGIEKKDWRKSAGNKTMPVTLDEHGNVRYDVIVKQNENSKKIVYSQHEDLIPKFLKDDHENEKQEEIEETTKKTKAAIEKIINVRLNAVPTQSSSGSKFIKYKPSEESAAFNSGAKERIIRMAETPVDPLEPSKFKAKKIPKAPGSPPVPVMQSPPRSVTVKDQKEWKVPPCISNWKNPKGYTIPLDKRLATDGSGLQEVRINDNFAKQSEALYVAEQKAREAVGMRSKVQKEMMMKDKEKKDMELRELARKARYERTGAEVPIPCERDEDDGMGLDSREKETKEEREEILQREKIREQRRRERERERRLEAKDGGMGKKRKISRDRDRDISEKVALGMASIGRRGGEVMYDQRLLNQDKGMDSGFAAIDDSSYNIYDKRLFTTAQSTLYRPKKDDLDSDMHGDDKVFAGTSERSRSGHVEFEKEAEEEADPFGLDQFLTELKKGKKAMERVGSLGTLKGSAGSMRDGFETSGRNRIAFERGH